MYRRRVWIDRRRARAHFNTPETHLDRRAPRFGVFPTVPKCIWVDRRRARANLNASEAKFNVWTDRRRTRAHPSGFWCAKAPLTTNKHVANALLTDVLVTDEAPAELSLAERSEAHRAKRGAARSAAAAEGGRRRRRPRAARGLQSQARMRFNWPRLSCCTVSHCVLSSVV